MLVSTDTEKHSASTWVRPAWTLLEVFRRVGTLALASRDFGADILPGQQRSPTEVFANTILYP